mgnify:CR=1 FL=1
MLEHGGQLIKMAEQYSIGSHDWLDLSTGINPHGWPVPAELPASLWSQLPEDDDGLIPAAHAYYQTDSLLAVAGSQAAIQALPQCRAHSRVGVLSLAYAEHQHAWKQAGHDIIVLDPSTIDKRLHTVDVLIIINPNNPTGQRFSREQLLTWHQKIARRGGWLIVDEAFIDATPQHSLSSEPAQIGLIILRSLGKFFGLAGLRVGFVLADSALLRQLAEYLGPWPIASPSRYIAHLALADKQWQATTRQSLQQDAQKLHAILAAAGFKQSHGCALFQWVETEQADKIHQQLASQGIYTRLFEQPKSLRFGLAKTPQDWQRLSIALHGLSH